jgi:ATP-dependent Clp protease ATP-binding subunit ClpA
LTQIASLLLKKTAMRLQKLGIRLTVEPCAIDALCSIGTHENMGARPLRRAIAEHIENLLAGNILKGELTAGQHVTITFSDDKFQCSMKTDEQISGISN